MFKVELKNRVMFQVSTMNVGTEPDEINNEFTKPSSCELNRTPSATIDERDILQTNYAHATVASYCMPQRIVGVNQCPCSSSSDGRYFLNEYHLFL